MKNEFQVGRAYNTKTIVVLCEELIRLTNKLLDTTRDRSMWQKRAFNERKSEAKAIKEVAKSLYEVVCSW